MEVWFQTSAPGAFGAYHHGTKGDCIRPRPYRQAQLLCADKNIYSCRFEWRDRRYLYAVKLAWAPVSTPKLADWEQIDEVGPFKRPARQPGKYTFAFGSCAHQERFAEHQPIWGAVAKEKPDCFLFIGDNIYLPSDPAKYPETRDEVLALYRDTYDRNRRMPELQPLLRSCYTFAIWDDHDFGPNNSDRTWKWADVALQALNDYFPNDYGLPDARGCFHKFSWGDVDVFMLDDRTFRDPNKDPQRRTMFGEKQLAWLKDGLAASQATFKLVVNGNQMLSDMHPHESWGIQFRTERDEFLRWLWDSDVRGVIFLAGDRHFAELVRKKDPQGKGEDLWELTSSPLANSHYKSGDIFPCRERVSSYCGGVNFGLVEIVTAATPPRAVLKLKNVEGKTVFKKTVLRKDRK